MDRLNVVGMIVSPSATHAARTDVIGHHIGVVAELPFAQRTDSVLSKDFPVEELPHLSVRSYLSVSAWMLRIINAPNANLLKPYLSRNGFPATTE
jgi:hypothetical protein